MNRSYRTIFNATLGTWVAAPETARGRGKGKVLAAVSVATLGYLGSASAATWIGGSGSWFESANWDTGVPTVSVDATVTNGGTAQVQSGNASAAFVWIGGVGPGSGTLVIGNGGTLAATQGFLGLTPGSAGSVTVTGSGSAWTSEGVSVGLSGSGTLAIDSGGKLTTTAGSAVATHSGGSGTVTVTGSGSQWDSKGTLSVGDTGTGTLTVSNGGTVQVGDGTKTLTLGRLSGSSGMLNIGSGGAAGTVNAAEVRGGDGIAVLNFNHTNSSYYFTSTSTAGGAGVVISGSTAVNQTGTGTTILTTANTYTGGTTVSAGTLRSGAAGAFVANTAYTINGGTLDLNNYALTMSSLSGSGGTVNLGSASLTVNENVNTSYAGAVTGSGSLTKQGSGTLTLTGANTYSGGTTVSAGALQIGSGGATGSITGNVANNASLVFYRSNAMTFAGDISGSGSLTQLGAGTLTLSGTNTYTGGTTVSAGTLLAGSASALSSNTAYTVNGGTLALNDYALTVSSLLGSGGTVNLGSAALVIDQGTDTGYAGAIAGSGSLTKQGSGTLTLTGTNTYTGGTTVLEGTLRSGGTNAFVSNTAYTVNGGTLDLNNYALTMSSLSGSGGTVNLGSASLRVDQNANTSYAGTIAGGVSLTKLGLGTLTLTGTNNYGYTAVEGGTLAISNGGVVRDAGGYIGHWASNDSVVTVDGLGSSWNSWSTYVGYNGDGTLSISNGGKVDSGEGRIGDQSGSRGAVKVDGTSSNWSIGNGGGMLYVGYSGSGRLDISRGGTATAGGSFIGYESGSSGAVTVDGASASWNNIHLFVGVLGTGSLAVHNGGAVLSDGAGLGWGAGADGTVTVDGAGSAFNSRSLIVGHYGNGLLSIGNGATVSVATGGGSLSLATESGSIGTLDIGNGGAAGILNAAEVNGGAGTAALNFNHSDSAYYFTTDGTASGTSVVISGSTWVNHIGSGTTFLSGDHTYMGTTTVDAGKLVVNGSIVGDAYVNAGGTLGGSGTLGNVTVASGGTLSPGDSPGILTINGDLTLSAGSTTIMEINGATPGTEYDQINVSGTATLDGTLDLRFGYAPTGGTRFNLINAGSLVLAGDAQTGFSPVVDNFGALSSNLGAALEILVDADGIDGDSFDILIRQLSFVTPGASLTPNQTSVAANLDTFVGSGQGTSLFNALNMLSGDQLPDAFDSLSGVQHTHATQQAARVTRQFRDLLGARLAGEAGNANTARFENVRLAYDGNQLATLFDTQDGQAASGVWLRAIGGVGDIDSDRNARGADYKSAGVAAGFDSRVSADLLAGVAFGYTRSDVDLVAGSLDLDSYQFALYGRGKLGAHYLDASLGVGHHRTDSQRQVEAGSLSGVARADYASSGVSVAVEAGRRLTVSAQAGITPYTALDYGRIHRSAFDEWGAAGANLSVAGGTFESLRSTLGARLDGSFSAGGAAVGTTLGLGWAHEHFDRSASLEAAFAVNGGGASYRIDGPEVERNRLQTTLGIGARLAENIQVDVDYRGEYARSDDHHALSATFKMQW